MTSRTVVTNRVFNNMFGKPICQNLYSLQLLVELPKIWKIVMGSDFTVRWGYNWVFEVFLIENWKEKMGQCFKININKFLFHSLYNVCNVPQFIAGRWPSSRLVFVGLTFNLANAFLLEGSCLDTNYNNWKA